MLDVEDFEALFQGVSYDRSLVARLLTYKHTLGGTTFFERLLTLLKIKGTNVYPPRNPRQFHDLHTNIIASETTLHNKHCLFFYLLKDLSPRQHEPTELATHFAREVQLERRFWTFIEGLWALDHLEFRTAVEHLTHPSIIPTFPDVILHTLLSVHIGTEGFSVHDCRAQDALPLGYYDCVKPPLDDIATRDLFTRYLAARNVTATYLFIQDRPAHERTQLLEILVDQTLASISPNPNRYYPHEERAAELVGLPFTAEEEEYIEKFLTEGKGRGLPGARDTVLTRRMVMGRFGDVVGDVGTTGPIRHGVNWEVLKDGVLKGIAGRTEKGFV